MCFRATAPRVVHDHHAPLSQMRVEKVSNRFNTCGSGPLVCSGRLARQKVGERRRGGGNDVRWEGCTCAAERPTFASDRCCLC